MRFLSYFNHALLIIGSYDGRMPLSRYLKQYFAGHRKHGSTDRKMISHACYSYYRLGQALKELPPPERLKAALFLCTEDPGKWSEVLDGETCPSFAVEDIFPWKDELSEGIDHHSFCLSFLRQPDLFLRIRPGHEKEVIQKLGEKLPQDPRAPGIPNPLAWQFIPPFTLRLPNSFHVEEFFTPDKEIVVQDYSSQRLAPYLQLPGDGLSVWDACAASGGKSILAYDLNNRIKLTVSDIRQSILHNLDRRFQTAGIKNYQSFVADLTRGDSLPAGRSTFARPATGHSGAAKPVPPVPRATPFDLIIADVPCSGSGTWSRTPEELFFFDPAKIGVYRELQEKILSRLVPSLGKKASLVYSTCSVFKKENEEMAAFIGESLGLRPEHRGSIKGYEDNADSMFAARFIS